jgi:hypothetical protein
MIRQSLLVETLIQRRTTRKGQIYLYRRPTGPPTLHDDALDRWLHKATQVFDFTPLVNGDQIQAREVAMGYIRHLKQEASSDGLAWKDVSARLRQINPHLRRGFQTFAAYFDAQTRTAS